MSRELRAPWLLAAAVGCGFASFYSFYAAAPLLFLDSRPSYGVRVAGSMAVVVFFSSLVSTFGRLIADRARALMVALIAIAIGYGALGVAGGLSLLLLGAGFGVLIVVGAAWTRELVAAENVGRAMGVYGFGSAIGGVIGAPLGLLFAGQVGLGVAALSGALASLAGLIPTRMVARAAPARSQGAGVGSGGNRSRVPTDGELESGDATSGLLSAGVAGDAELGSRRVTSDLLSAGVAGDAETESGDAADGRRSADAVGRPQRGDSWRRASVNLGAHFIAVVIYGVALSQSATLGDSATAAIVVIAAAAIQVAVALGRLASGAISDRWSAQAAGGLGAVLLAPGVALLLLVDRTDLSTTGACALVGFGSGAIQTATLTLLMRGASDRRQIERVSGAWNVTFDLALAVAALLAAAL